MFSVEEDLLVRARDAGYTAVGFGVLAFQQLQVRRRELMKDVAARVGGREGVVRMVRRAEAAVDPVLDQIEHRLPGQARSAVRQARTATRFVERIVLG